MIRIVVFSWAERFDVVVAIPKHMSCQSLRSDSRQAFRCHPGSLIQSMLHCEKTVY
jgi:hypothetical protein